MLIGHRGQARITPVEIHVPETAAAACRLRRMLPGSVYLAGGLDVVNRLKAGAGYRHLISLEQLPGFKQIEAAGNTVVIGSGVTHHALARSPVLAGALPTLAAFLAGLGNIRIRVQGTLAGNIMAGEAGYEGLAMLLALDAVLRVETIEGVVEFPVRRLDPAVLPPEALITRITVPAGQTLAWDRTLRPLLGLVLSVDRAGGRRTAALSGLHNRSFATDLADTDTDRAEQARIFAARMPAPDVTVDADYARRAVAVLLRRTLERA